MLTPLALAAVAPAAALPAAAAPAQAAATAPGQTDTAATGQPIAAPGGSVRASQIAVVPARLDTVLARLPEGAAAVQWTEETRRALLARRYPGGGYPLRQGGTVRIVRAAPAQAEDAGCLAAAEPLAEGAYLTAADVTAVPCRQEAFGGWLAYDTGARAFYARRAIPRDAYLGRFTASAPPAARAGAPLVLRAAEGPVVVEREVVALQSGRGGRAIFVRTGEGEVLAARLAATGSGGVRSPDSAGNAGRRGSDADGTAAATTGEKP